MLHLVGQKGLKDAHPLIATELRTEEVVLHADRDSPAIRKRRVASRNLQLDAVAPVICEESNRLPHDSLKTAVVDEVLQLRLAGLAGHSQFQDPDFLFTHTRFLL